MPKFLIQINMPILCIQGEYDEIYYSYRRSLKRNNSKSCHCVWLKLYVGGRLTVISVILAIHSEMRIFSNVSHNNCSLETLGPNKKGSLLIHINPDQKSVFHYY